MLAAAKADLEAPFAGRSRRRLRKVERQTRQELVDQRRLTLSERLAFRAAIETGVSAALLRGLAHKR
jgi:hypothetical protein